MKKLLILFMLALEGIVICAEQADISTVDLIKGLLQLKGSKYIAVRSIIADLPEIEHESRFKDSEYIIARNEVLKRDDLETAIAHFRRISPDWKSSVLADALLYRKKYAEESSRIDSGLSLDSFGPHAGSPRGSLISIQEVHCSPYVIVICFGAQAAPIIMESLLFSGEMNPPMAADALVNMHVIDAVPTFLEMAKNKAAIIQATAIYNLDKLLNGLKAEKVGTKINVKRASELVRKFGSERNLPELCLNTDTQIKIKDVVLAKLIAENCEPQVKALAVYLLRRFNDNIVTKEITSLLTNDLSPWVRAWCAVSLRTIGSEEALKAIDAAKKTEKNAEVLMVLEDKAKPIEPWYEIPTDSILQKSNDTPSNAP